MNNQEMLEKAIEKIDAINSNDPDTVLSNGVELAGEVLYSQRMTHWLFELEKNPSIALQIAVRANHVGRWQSPRSSYPADRDGYLNWRTDLIQHHQNIAKEVLEELSAPYEVIERVQQIMSKKGLKQDAEIQTYEDTICLVFLEHYLANFYISKDVEEEKMVSILRKTWYKMSEKGQENALKLELPEASKNLLKKALG